MGPRVGDPGGDGPGCLGAFTGVALYVHGVIPLGALCGSMIAASGDEAFVMLALFPGKAVLLFGILFAYGLAVGLLLDRLLKRPYYKGSACCSGLALHEGEVPEAIGRWRRDSFGECSLPRAVLTLGLTLFVVAVAAGVLGPPEWNWVRMTLIALSAVALFIVFTVPEHFLEEHLYRHVAVEHVPRIFGWTFGALLVMAWIAGTNLPVEAVIREHPGAAILVAGLLGIIPESGPHLIFATMFAQGLLPFSVLMTSSVVQDGHGMLPLLAESRLEFLKVKAINLTAGLALGYGAQALGV